MGGGGGRMGAMNRYVTLQALGDGTYGSVMLGQRVDTGEKVGSSLTVFAVFIEPMNFPSFVSIWINFTDLVLIFRLQSKE